MEPPKLKRSMKGNTLENSQNRDTDISATSEVDFFFL